MVQKKRAENIVNCLSYRNKHIQFTLEKQKKNKLNFLDLTTTIINNKFHFHIYSKSTQTDSIKPHDSNHLYSQKNSFFNSIFYRLERFLRTYVSK